MKSQTWRLAITGVFVILAFIGFWNTLRLWTLDQDDKDRMEQVKPGSVSEMERKAMRLGLDLQGGIHVVLRVEMEKLDKGAREDAVDRAIQVIRNRVDFTGVTEPIIQKQGNDRIIVDLPGFTDAEQAEEIIGQTAQLEFKLLETYENAQMILRKIDSAVAEVRKADQEKGVDLSDAEVSVTEPVSGEATPVDLEAEADDDILADLMGDDSGEFIDDMLFDSEDNPLTQYLEPYLANDKNNTMWPGYVVQAKDRRAIEKMLEMPQVQRLIPAEMQFAWSTRSDIRQAYEVYCAVSRKIPGKNQARTRAVPEHNG